MHRTLRPTLWATLLIALTAAPLSAQVPVTLITRGYDGQPANGDSFHPSVSSNGRYVAYDSSASNLVLGDTNYHSDVFVTDQSTGKTVCASIPTGPHAPIANGYSINPSISADGRFVAFESAASNLVPGDTNGSADVFVRDLLYGTTRRVSVASDGTQALASHSQAPSISADGRFVAFLSSSTNLAPGDRNGSIYDVFCHDLDTNRTSCESLTPAGISGNKHSGFRSVDISSDGRYVSFFSEADDLVASDGNGQYDLFVRDRQSGRTELISASASGVPGDRQSGGASSPEISADGRFVLFDSSATNLAPGGDPDFADLFLRDRETGSTECLVRTPYGKFDWMTDSSMDAAGRFVAYVASPSGWGTFHLVLWDRLTKKTRVLASKLFENGSFGLTKFFDMEMSDDSRYIAYESCDAVGVRVTRNIQVLGPIMPSRIDVAGAPGSGAVAAYNGSTFSGTFDGRLHAYDLVAELPRPGFPANVSALVGTPVSLLGRPAVYGYSGATGEPALYLTTDKGHVVKMGLDGKLHWKAQPDPTATRCSSTPAVTSNGQVFVGLNGALGPRVFRLDARTGSVVAASVWLGKGTGDITSLAVVGDRVYGGVTDGTYGSLVMLDATSLFPLARSIAPGEGVTAPPYVLGQYAWAGTLTGNLYKMSVNTFNPDPLFDKPNGSGKAEITEPIPGGIFPGTDKLYVGTSQGKVFAIDPVTGGGKSTPFYDTGTTEPINGVLVDRTSNTLHFGCGSTFYSVPLNSPSTARKEPVEGKLLSTPVLDPWTKMVIVATDTGNLYRFNP